MSVTKVASTSNIVQCLLNQDLQAHQDTFHLNCCTKIRMESRLTSGRVVIWISVVFCHLSITQSKSFYGAI